MGGLVLLRVDMARTLTTLLSHGISKYVNESSPDVVVIGPVCLKIV